nr:MAG TPA: hypothetical protein [Caudoviricetes sp.]DAT19414.1 MAG TPA: hypothetical protein [Caudoviricetes sp.]
MVFCFSVLGIHFVERDYFFSLLTHTIIINCQE